MAIKRLLGTSVVGAVLAVAVPAFAQAPQAPSASSPAQSGSMPAAQATRPATTSVNGDTGLFFVPTGETLPNKKWSVSFYRLNWDDGQGFTDVSNFPATFAVGVSDHVEIFGNWSVITRVDRDTRPVFFTSTSQEASTGTGGGIVVTNPGANSHFTGNKLGDLWLGAKFNLASEADQRPLAFALRPMVKLPTGDSASGASSGKADFAIDAIVSKRTSGVEVSAYGGVIARGNPTGYKLTNGFRWGVGAGFPQTHNMGLVITTELFGESYFNKTLTAPATLVGTDGSVAPTLTTAKSPIYAALGLTWQAPGGFFIGASTTKNLTMHGRADATPDLVGLILHNTPKDTQGFEIRIGFHPGVRQYVPPPPPPPPAPPAPPAVNRPPTVHASCDPCTVELGKTSTVSADAQDPDGDALTYQWETAAGSLTSPTSRQSPWTAPMQEGPVRVTVTVNDGKGGTASDAVTIQVIKPPVKEYTFEDVHFGFDQYDLKPDALRILDEAVSAMQADSTLRMEIEGHTDSIGTNEYNMALGERRATSVRDYIVSRGISADRLSTISYGEERPKYDNAREETRRLNRRAALVVRLVAQ